MNESLCSVFLSGQEENSTAAIVLAQTVSRLELE